MEHDMHKRENHFTSIRTAKQTKAFIYSSFLAARSDTLSTSSVAVASADFFASAIAVSMRDIGSELFFKKSFRKLSYKNFAPRVWGNMAQSKKANLKAK
mmetsp:Transcript_8533/g.20978  ORF Transcript_8533/g.20978 Transcript_8533/m.20978 type:complete len:99 (-) Transcript_8533:480-776(-)